jgi:hypothetical protein
VQRCVSVTQYLLLLGLALLRQELLLVPSNGIKSIGHILILMVIFSNPVRVDGCVATHNTSLKNTHLQKEHLCAIHASHNLQIPSHRSRVSLPASEITGREGAHVPGVTTPVLLVSEGVSFEGGRYRIYYSRHPWSEQLHRHPYLAWQTAEHTYSILRTTRLPRYRLSLKRAS